jgi:hypothetical protein
LLERGPVCVHDLALPVHGWQARARRSRWRPESSRWLGTPRFHHVLGGPDHATGVIRERSGRAFDPVVAIALADAGPDLLSVDATDSLWEQTLAIEPGNSGMITTAVPAGHPVRLDAAAQLRGIRERHDPLMGPRSL